MRLTFRRLLFTLLILLLLVTSVVSFFIYYYREKEHLVYEAADPSIGLRLRGICKWDGNATYNTYATVETIKGNREIYRLIVGCGSDTLSDCSNNKSECGISRLFIDNKQSTLGVEYGNGQLELYPMPEQLKRYSQISDSK